MEILKKEDIQLLLIDVMMPRLDGIRATLKIREKSSIQLLFCQQNQKIQTRL